MWGLVAAVALAGGSAPRRAGAPGPDFEWLAAAQVGRTVKVDYIRVKGPVPERSLRLVVKTRDGRSFAMPVMVGRRRGHWTFPDLPRRVDALELRCPTGCRIQGIAVRGVSLPVFDGGDATPPPPPAELHPKLVPQWQSDRTVIETCERAFISDRDELACLDFVAGFAESPVPAVRACDDAFVGSADQLACVEAAAEAPRDPSEAIRACGEAFTGDASQLTCVEATVRMPLVAPAVVRACGAAFVSQTAQASCIALGLQRPTRAPEIVQACDEAFVGESEQLQCIEKGLPPR